MTSAVAIMGTARQGMQYGVDLSTMAMISIGYEHHEVHAGSHYFVGGYQDLSLNNVLQFTWQMPATPKRIHWTWKISTESETLWKVYEGGSIVTPLTTAITPRNNNRNSSNTSGTALRFEKHANLEAADAAVNVAAATELESGISGAGRDAGNALRTNELILKEGELYVLRATANAAGNVSFYMQWYEHTDRYS